MVYGKGAGTLATKHFSKSRDITCVGAVGVSSDWGRGERNEWLWQGGVSQIMLTCGLLLKKISAAGYAMLQRYCLDSKGAVFVDDL